MVFKRRDRRPIWQIVADFVYPRGGWGRAFEYVKHRVRRLPDTPERISRGVWAGVFTAFTPFYGLHFLVAFLIAKLMRGNILAALMGTFFGNPLTYIPIGVTALETGYFMTGRRSEIDSVGRNFARAFGDLWFNIKAIFTKDVAQWDYIFSFYYEVFFPYMVGGIIPGIISATAVYMISVPLITAYQNRRRKRLRAKLEQLRNSGQSQDGNGPSVG